MKQKNDKDLLTENLINTIIWLYENKYHTTVDFDDLKREFFCAYATCKCIKDLEEKAKVVSNEN